MCDLYFLNCDAVGPRSFSRRPVKDTGAAFRPRIRVLFRNREHRHRDRLVKPPRTAAPRIEAEDPVDVLLRVLVAVAVDDYICVHVCGNILFLVRHEKLAAIQMHLKLVRDISGPIAVVVAADCIEVSAPADPIGSGGPACAANLFQRFRSAYVPAVQNCITGLYYLNNFRTKQVMRIRDHGDPVPGPACGRSVSAGPIPDSSGCPVTPQNFVLHVSFLPAIFSNVSPVAR